MCSMRWQPPPKAKQKTKQVREWQNEITTATINKRRMRISLQYSDLPLHKGESVVTLDSNQMKWLKIQHFISSCNHSDALCSWNESPGEEKTILDPHRYQTMDRNVSLQTECTDSQRSSTCASQAITKIENCASGGCCTKAPHIKADCCRVCI